MSENKSRLRRFLFDRDPYNICVRGLIVFVLIFGSWAWWLASGDAVYTGTVVSKTYKERPYRVVIVYLAYERPAGVYEAAYDKIVVFEFGGCNDYLNITVGERYEFWLDNSVWQCYPTLVKLEEIP